MLNFALKYLSLGFSVIPLRPGGKEPLLPWAEFQKRRASLEEVKEWFKKWPTANIGLVTGSISGVIVIDLDGPEGIQSAQEHNLSSSVVSLTGDGKHLWLRCPMVPVQNAVRIFPGVDIRGEGGYVVAPPSVHENGRRYRFLNALSVKSLDALSEMPKALYITSPVVNTVSKEDSWISTALKEMKLGNIDDTLFTICSRLRADGYSREDARSLLAPHADQAGATPGHLEDKIENVWERYTPNPPRPIELFHNSIRPSSGQAILGGLVIHSPSNSASWETYRLRFEEHGNNDNRLTTGYIKLDSMFKGGLKSSRLCTIAARTGVGKTNFVLGIARTLCEAGRKVLLFSTEMPYAEIWERYLETLEDKSRFREHAFYVCDSFAPNLERVEEALRATQADVFIFDHINHVSEEQSELGRFMQGLNLLRRKYDCAGIVTAQLNRQADWVDIKTGEKVTPRMSMIKGSGTIEQASSRVLLLSEVRISPEGTEIVGNLDKNDNGPKGLLHFMLKTSPYKMVEL